MDDLYLYALDCFGIESTGATHPSKYLIGSLTTVSVVLVAPNFCIIAAF